MEETMDILDCIMRWEEGTMEHAEEVEFFQHLIDTRLVFQLQGMYGRHAQRLIDAGECHC